ncbi:transcriptional regulator [Amnibacterium flavum]|uniref:Transcriptional regulator n=1 Tax=Amnibacterium flavum TaxID=2173173 RepID=A0A2V1HUM7_9MICO|nr:transcriptional regulator [Amnibacterium flavum]
MARTLEIVGERWTLLVVREAFLGRTRFAEIRERLGVAPDVLTDRLDTLVAFGVLERSPYRDGGRTRDEYLLTDAGRGLGPVLIALAEWGDEHRPPRVPQATHAVDGATGATLRVALLREDGSVADPLTMQLRTDRPA